MKLTVLLVTSLFLFLSPSKKINIYMIGDSTMANKPLEDNPERGWGMFLGNYFDSTKVRVENHAMNGRSTRTFISESRWQTVLNKLQKGDYVVIQFGHNDESVEKKDRYTPPSQFKINLARFVMETRAHKAIPILCTSIVRRKFNSEGILQDTHGIYPGLVRRVADSLNVLLVDMQKKSEKLVQEFGPEKSKELYLHILPGQYNSLPNGKEDNTHFSAIGANKMAGLFVEGLKELKVKKLAKLVKIEQ